MGATPQLDRRDWLDTLEELHDIYEDIRTHLERYDDLKAAIEAVNRMDSALARWREAPEDIVRGIDLANSNAQMLASLGEFVPESLPEVRQLFEAIPRVVNALGEHLKARIRLIDSNISRATGEVRLDDRDDSPSCSGGRLDGTGARIIRALRVSDRKKATIFRAACYGGLEQALTAHLPSGLRIPPLGRTL